MFLYFFNKYILLLTLEKEMAIHFSILAWRMDGGAWQATVSGIAESRTQLSIFHFASHCF